MGFGTPGSRVTPAAGCGVFGVSQEAEKGEILLAVKRNLHSPESMQSVYRRETCESSKRCLVWCFGAFFGCFGVFLFVWFFVVVILGVFWWFVLFFGLGGLVFWFFFGLVYFSLGVFCLEKSTGFLLCWN